ncbi:MAG: porin family protein [Bacteroidales bacterium]|nr:porin family protein [Bacteroidales bacterium]
MTNNELDKQWLNECRASMQNFEAPAPADGWASIAASVGAEKAPGVAPQVKPAPAVPLRTWLWRAAAILLLILLVGGGVWLGLSDGETASPDFHEQMAAVPSTPDNGQPSLAEVTEEVEPVTSKSQPMSNVPSEQPSQKASHTSNRQPLAEAKNILPEPELSRSHSEGIPKDEATTVNEQTASELVSEIIQQESERQDVTADYADSLMHSDEVAVLQALQGKIACLDISDNTPRWTVSAGLGVGGESSRSGSAGFQYGAMSSSNSSLSFTTVDGPAPSFLFSNDVFDLESNEVLAAYNKVPLRVPEAPKADDGVCKIDNHKAVTLGATVSIRLKERLAVISGLAYTKLTSDVACTYSSCTQNVHYLGVPLSLQYTLYGRGRWRCYASGGGMVERLLQAERGGVELSMPDWQWSAQTAVGVQFQLLRHWSLYAEPGVAYFFDNGSDVPTYRSEHPCAFTLQAGVRLMY